MSSLLFFFFFFNDTATTEIYTLSLHDALPISRSAISIKASGRFSIHRDLAALDVALQPRVRHRDRKSTRLNSSHSQISYAVFCLKKKTVFSFSKNHFSSPSGLWSIVLLMSISV